MADRKTDFIKVPDAIAQAAEHRIAPAAKGVETPAEIVDATIANQRDPQPISADSKSIRNAIERGMPVLVDGEKKFPNGKTRQSWVAVEGYDQKTKTFIVAEPGQSKTVSSTAKELDAFARSASGGDAIALAPEADRGPSNKTLDAVLKVVPTGDCAYARIAVPLILDECARQGVTDHGQIAYILATAEHESQFGKPVYASSVPLVEDAYDRKDPVSDFNARYGGDDGNRPDTNDGYNYRGRGYVQITNRGAYERASANDGLAKVVLTKEPVVSLDVDKAKIRRTFPVRAPSNPGTECRAKARSRKSTMRRSRCRSVAASTLRSIWTRICAA